MSAKMNPKQTRQGAILARVQQHMACIQRTKTSHKLLRVPERLAAGTIRDEISESVYAI